MRRSKAEECERWYQKFQGRNPRKDGSLPTKPVVPCMDLPESQVLEDCLKWLRGRGCLADRMNTGAHQNNMGQWYRYGIKGAGDILVVYHGLHIEVECKAGRGGSWSMPQQRRERHVTEHGGVYVIVHGIEELGHLWASNVAPRFRNHQ